MNSKINKATRHTSQNEGLIFEKSSPGKRAFELPPLDVPSSNAAAELGKHHRAGGVAGFPEVSEIEVVRHFTRLSTWNYAIDLGLYPLGSCTMKYNPRVNEAVARTEGLMWIHPYQPDALSQGAFAILAELERVLAEITGMDAVTLQPAAGAHGELTGILLVRAYLEAQGNARKRVIVPDSAHGTNPASVRMAGYEVVNVASNDRGMLDAAALGRMVDEDVAAIMITNPNTLGVFEEHISEVARILHAKGALVYMDGANMNALAGISRPGDYGIDLMHLNLHKTFSTPHGGGGPGSGPVAVKKPLEAFLPLPRLQRAPSGWSWNYDRPQSIGRVRAFYGNFGVLVRALAYIMAHGGDGLKRATLDALLNANYLRKLLEPHYQIAYHAPSMHECVFHHPSTGAIAKRLIDYGFHPYTVSFPLIVHGAMMIEPTETESKQELDLFAEALISIAQEEREHPDLVSGAPHSTRTTKVDEVAAARKPILKWSR